jgi:hypothetical protein
LTPSELLELDRLLKLSFNPLSVTLLTQQDKEFLWSLRYNILHKENLLPAFVMCVEWQDSEKVQELYDLLDIWKQPRPEEALQLLDRRLLFIIIIYNYYYYFYYYYYLLFLLFLLLLLLFIIYYLFIIIIIIIYFVLFIYYYYYYHHCFDY